MREANVVYDKEIGRERWTFGRDSSYGGPSGLSPKIVCVVQLLTRYWLVHDLLRDRSVRRFNPGIVLCEEK